MGKFWFKRGVLLAVLISLSVILVGCWNKADKKGSEESAFSQGEAGKGGALEDKVYSNYLKKNTAALDIEDNDKFSTLKLLEKDTKDKEIFLIGESHYVKDNLNVQWKLLKYFKQKTNFKYLLWETSYLAGKRYNEYLNTGDEKLISELINTKQESEFWKKLYEYNKTLKQEDKIQVVAPDIGNIDNNVNYLIDVLSLKDLPVDMKGDLTLLKEYKSYIETFSNLEENQSNKEKYVDTYLKENIEKFTTLYKSIEEKKSSYENILKEDYFEFNYVLKNLRDYIEVQENAINYVKTNDFAEILRIRDLKIAENFNILYEKLPKGKYFGKWGDMHTYQKEVLSAKGIKTNNFAAQLNKEGSPLKGKILTITTFYDKCFTSMSGHAELFSNYKSNKVMDEVIKSNHTLIKLNNNNSPYSKELKWDFVKDEYGKAEDGVTTDYFQYIIIIKDSESDVSINN
ncbi:erythromycin esterase family protein [Clostridium tunisiense]|uniref:erythromycin esterase family protein n=1 Tax=Clostridium tunisiense TaxID=219748 RepID=UPI0003183087|nr:erythromycin esterase family protein [Clostridium tunisiense]